MNNIILIGFMGSGKTSFGKWLMKNRGMNFVDTDEYIEKLEGRTINEIFRDSGETYFRELETETVKKLIACKYDNTVFSVGGGLPVKEVNGRLLHELGTVVYLKAGVDTLCKRLSGDKKRPLLAGGDLRKKITDLMSVRADIYEAVADIAVETDNLDFLGVYERIKRHENTCD